MKTIRRAVPILVAAALAVGVAGAATPITVTSSIAGGQTLTGKVKWTATVSTTSVSKVEFFVDGTLKSTERSAPFVYGGDEGLLDTTALANGSHVFAVTATATDGTKATASATATTKNPPVSTSPPTVSGTAREGSTLSGSRGAWTGPATITYAYNWVRCDTAGGSCVTISGATGSSYRLTAGDVGHRVRFGVNASNGAGTVGAVSEPTAVVTPSGSAPASRSLPGISGSTRDGALLTASTGSWANSPTSFAYRWLRCDANGTSCGPIGGANARQYTLTTADVGHRLRVTVTASNSHGSGTATSNATGVVEATASPPASTSAPVVTGTLTAGGTATAANGGWSGTQPLTFSYVWQRCDAAGNGCGDIPGATGSSYGVLPADVRHTLRVVVTARNARGTASATSGPSALVTTGQALDVAQVALPNVLVIDRVRFTPRRIRSRLEPLVARFHVADSRGFSVAGALVLALGLPYGWVGAAPEAMTDGAGWATIVLRPTAALPKQGALVVFVRARKPGEGVLGGVTARRLVQAGIRRR